MEELIREEMNSLLDCEISDPNLDGVRITVVTLSPDGARARLQYAMEPTRSEHGSHHPEAALRRATGFFRRELCDALSLRRTPELRFSLDFAECGVEEEERV